MSQQWMRAMAETRPSSDGGRACGCDPKVGHVCDGHRRHLDRTETEIEGAAVYQGSRREPMIIVVTGPDEDGEFGILGAGGEWSVMPRFVAEDLIYELQKRLSERA